MSLSNQLRRSADAWASVKCRERTHVSEQHRPIVDAEAAQAERSHIDAECDGEGADGESDRVDDMQGMNTRANLGKDEGVHCERAKAQWRGGVLETMRERGRKWSSVASPREYDGQQRRQNEYCRPGTEAVARQNQFAPCDAQGRARTVVCRRLAKVETAYRSTPDAAALHVSTPVAQTL
ncbi:hypothetical protein ANO11243_075760 [Dothideomycetidae sp. 11243]|nr:hypothetical protein ANO11243_075760 [fungal sp. No.11243]